MQFNQEYINQLAEGKAILGHTEDFKDLELIRAILTQAFPKDGFASNGNARYYFKASGNEGLWSDIEDKLPKDLPIIPLHDFVSPTKEEKITIDSLDARLKELEGLVKGNGYTIAPKEGKIDEVDYIYRKAIVDLNGYKKDTIYKIKASKLMDFWAWTIPAREADYLSQKEEQPKAEWTPKVGEWFKVNPNGLYLRIEFEGRAIMGNNQAGGIVSCSIPKDITKPTEQEVGDYLIGLAKQRYPVGTRFSQQWSGLENLQVKKGLVSISPELYVYVDSYCVYCNKQWAEVLPQAKEYNVNIIQNHSKYEIRVTGLNHAEAEHYQAIIKNALTT